MSKASRRETNPRRKAVISPLGWVCFVMLAFNFIVCAALALIRSFSTPLSPSPSNPSHEFKNRPVFNQVFTCLLHVTNLGWEYKFTALPISSDVNLFYSNGQKSQ